MSEWLKPALEGINSILAGGPILIKPEKSAIAASGNASTTIHLVESHPVESQILPWASVNKYGRGHAVLLGANVSKQAGACPDNATWISNLIALLGEESRRFVNLHPSISAVSAKHFARGDNDEAVFAALKAVEHRVQALTDCSDSGKTLMANIFNEKSAALDIAHDNANHRQRDDEAEGFKFLFMGAMQGFEEPTRSLGRTCRPTGQRRWKCS
ncbi:TIGR02391 family protein [Mycolicibacterium novocastrense]|nr:TIGR02391 family protein [Mycolicibacterium novocastrense]